MPLNQDLLFQRGKLIQMLRKRASHLCESIHFRFDLIQNADPLRLLGPSRKWQFSQIARQPDAAADHDRMMPVAWRQPISARGQYRADFHARSVPPTLIGGSRLGWSLPIRNPLWKLLLPGCVSAR